MRENVVQYSDFSLGISCFAMPCFRVVPVPGTSPRLQIIFVGLIRALLYALFTATEVKHHPNRRFPIPRTNSQVPTTQKPRTHKTLESIQTPNAFLPNHRWTIQPYRS